ncbi:MAG: 16S rRNA (uracil(1498)-N(3))-methyltransferase [Acidobacteriaceae bacterium]
MTRRRFIADTWEPASGRPERAALVGEQAEHLARVLRAEVGQVFDVVANGFLHRAEVVEVRRDGATEVRFVLHEELEADAALPVHLLLAVFRFEPMEWAIEKATELGVAKITPVLARRTEKHLGLAAAKRVERWRRIALESAKQSRRTDVPQIGEPLALAKALDGVAAGVKILLSETEQAVTLAAVVREVAGQDVALAIGPEGGWTAEEMALFAERGWHGVTLGPRILRAETAAVAGLAVVGALLGGD